MARHFRLVAVIGLLLVALGHSTPTRAQGNPSDEIFRLVNQFRAQYGLPPFTYNPNLAAAAQGHANYLASNGLYSHYGADGSSPQDRAERTGYLGWAGENYVAGTGLTPQQGVTWWSNSAPHFANMVSSRHTEAGVGYAFGSDQNYYVLVIGEPTSGPARGRPAEVLSDVPAFVAPITLSTPNEDGSIIHTVGAGHTIWAIAARYEVPISDIYLFNGLNEDSVINPGDELVIRLAEGQAPPPTPTPPATHLVLEGESLWSIAAWNKMDLGTLLWLNGMAEDAVVHPGNELKIRLLPGEEPPPTATPQLTYKVKSGDTAWGIALAYGLTLEQLAAFNNMDPNTLLQIGQELSIRAPTETPTATPPPTETPTGTPTPEIDLAMLVTPSPSATAPAVAMITPDLEAGRGTGGRSLGTALGIGAMIAGLGLTVFAGVAVMVLWRKQ